MTDDEKRAMLDALIQELAEDLAPLVQRIEAGLETTQHHYGDYMQAIARVARGDRQKARITALALVRAGANTQGVGAALRFCC